jgi:glycerol-3-phosphate acyltransferase PlsY
LVALFDVGKGATMVWIAQLLGLGIAQQVTVGLAVIIGHNWSIFLRFGGGRGILATLGVIVVLVPWLSPVALIIALLFVPFRQLALGVLISLISLPIFGWFLSQPLGINARLPITLGFLFALLIAIFKRLVAPRTSVTASVPTRQLFVNRLLFDRDIRDRKAWIQRAPPEVSPAEQPPSQQEKQEKD